jgi:hypothetical protein
MGPRSDERGKPNVILMCNYRELLQWGRAQMSAEIAARGTL